LDIDHCLPWSAWPCGDLWNLLPASPRVNQHLKRDLGLGRRARTGNRGRFAHGQFDHAINTTLYDKLNFTFYRDIAPVAGVMSAPQVIDVNSSSPVKTLPEFIALPKPIPAGSTSVRAASAARNTSPRSCSR
jgi:tripartite-type tricarboxylate transporter receptor subunit TctC